MSLSIQHWAKTAEGVEVIDTQKVFCINGELWQGYQKVAITVQEGQLEDKELEVVLDVDETLQKVWFKRRQRLEARQIRRNREYDDRRAKLRAERNELVQELRNQKDLGIEPSPDIQQQIQAINDRMARIAEDTKGDRVDLARAKEDPETAEKEVAAKALEPVQCAYCDAISPTGHPAPAKWRNGHQIHCKEAKKVRVGAN